MCFIIIAFVILHALVGAVVAWAWNTFLPLVWHAAPHIQWFHGAALTILIGMVGSLFGRRTVTTKD